jgi:diaminopimelate decarboxylase
VKPTEKPQRRGSEAFSYRVSKQGILRRRTGTSILHCDDVPLPELVERYGTPLYVYSASLIASRVKAFQQAFKKVPHTLCYSVKANSNLSILRLLSEMGCGFDIVSGGELERVLRVDKQAGKRVVFSGVGKTYPEMEAAVKAGILLFNVESESELAILAQCATRLKRKVSVALRVNPDVSAKTHPYIATGLNQHKFGIPIREARGLYARTMAAKYLQIAGVSVHIGSQITDLSSFGQAMERVGELVEQLRSDGHTIRYVDAGGGLGIDYGERELPHFVEYVREYAGALLRPLRALEVHLLLEPGRSIVGPAGALLTCVLYRKTNRNKKFLIVDAGMTDLVRPALYDAYHEIVPVEVWDDSSSTEIVDVVGPVCETGDFFARDRKLQMVKEHDLLAILDTGAYGMALTSNYNSRLRPAEVLVDGKSAKLVRRRETISDLMGPERIGKM